MTQDDGPGPNDSADDEVMRALLRRAIVEPKLGSGPPPEPQRLLRGVQQKIRRRSKGKFYSDGWSTIGGRVHYGIVALLMLLIVALAWFALGPLAFSTHP